MNKHIKRLFRGIWALVLVMTLIGATMFIAAMGLFLGELLFKHIGPIGLGVIFIYALGVFTEKILWKD